MKPFTVLPEKPASALSGPRRLAVLVAVAALALAPALAEARPSGGKSFGSRGSNTYSAPQSTPTAPGSAKPLERTMTPQAAPSAQPGVARPAAPAMAPAQQAARPSFGRSLMMGLGAGLLGAGLFGLLSGSGLFGGLGGIASFLGLLLQAALIAGVIMLAIRFFRRRQEMAQPAMAGAGIGGGLGTGGLGRQSYEAPPQPAPGVSGGSASAAPANADRVGLTGADFGAFEQLLAHVTDAFSREDVAALRSISTPEMVGFFAEDLAENARRGVIDNTRDVKLLQGDLSEAWREGDVDYATVAMRFSYIHTLTERATGKLVEGHATTPEEATEVWTFLRPRGGQWILSAIQQTS